MTTKYGFIVSKTIGLLFGLDFESWHRYVIVICSLLLIFKDQGTVKAKVVPVLNKLSTMP